MAGKPGRSGKVGSPEARERRRQAAALGTEAARIARGGGAMGASEGDLDDEADDESAPTGAALTDDEILRLLPGSNPYDAVVLKSRNRFTYLDGKTREQVRSVELENQKREAELAIARGRVLTREQAEARDEARFGATLEELNSIVDLAGSLVAPEQGAAARAKAQEWILGMRARVEARIRSARE